MAWSAYSRLKVYPRIHGGNARPSITRAASPGLSPHSRGKRTHRRCRRSAAGSIPAFTGETPAARCSRTRRGVYPRIHGGNINGIGSAVSESGLSPHSRGKLDANTVAWGNSRSIPAFTGETADAPLVPAVVQVYPRIHGGNMRRQKNPSPATGLSPHSRGKPRLAALAPVTGRSIPAFTGETSARLFFLPLAQVYPRIHGGNLPPPWRLRSPPGLSPHSRGKHVAIPAESALVRSIPAFTGETL